MVLASFIAATGPVENYINDLSLTLSSLLHSVAPLSTKTRLSKRSTLWFTYETHGLKCVNDVNRNGKFSTSHIMSVS